MKKNLLTLISIIASCTMNAQWISTSGPTGAGKISSLDTKGLQVMAGTETGGIFILDGTGTWNASNSGLTNMNDIQSLINNDTLIFAGAYNSLGGVAVFSSADDGATWDPTTLSFLFNFSLAQRPGLLIAGTWFGISASTDNGATWYGGTNGLPGNASVCGLAFNGTDVYCGVCGSGSGGTGVFKSIDDGVNWSPMNAGLTSPIVNELIVSGSYIFAGTAGGGVFRSPLSNPTWTAMNTGMGAQTINSFFITGGSLFAGTNTGIYRSDDEGQSWTDVSTGLPSNSVVHSITSDGNDLYVGTDSEVWVRPLSELITGVEAVEPQVNFYLSPNPVTDIISIHTDANNFKSASMSILNSVGEILRENKITSSSTSINIQSLPAGMYYARFNLDGKISMNKFSKVQ